MSTILECKNLSKKYGRKQALDNITLSLESGRIIGLLGPNGSGKTTLIKLINGLLAPTGGKLFINGNTPGVESKKIVSYLPERTYLDETQKVSEAITLFEDFYEDFDRSRAISMLEKLNIDSNARIKTLSKGTKEKVLAGVRRLSNSTTRLVIVTNEVNADINGYSEETEKYRECIGMVNQSLAELADIVTEVVYGIPVCIRKEQKKYEEYKKNME